MITSLSWLAMCGIYQEAITPWYLMDKTNNQTKECLEGLNMLLVVTRCIILWMEKSPKRQVHFIKVQRNIALLGKDNLKVANQVKIIHLQRCKLANTIKNKNQIGKIWSKKEKTSKCNGKSEIWKDPKLHQWDLKDQLLLLFIILRKFLSLSISPS